MGRAALGNRVSIDVLRTVATVATRIEVVAWVIRPSAAMALQTAPRYSFAGFPRRSVFAQASSVQTDADVRRGEINQRR